MATDTVSADALGDRCRLLAGQIAVLQGQLVETTAAYMAASQLGWGYRSWAHELSHDLGLVPAEARKLVAVAERADELPEVVAAMGRGEATLALVASMEPAATPDNESYLASLLPRATAAQVQRICATYRRQNIKPEPVDRWFGVRSRDNGVALQGRLDALEGDLIRKAVAARRDRLHEQTGQTVSAADALVAMAHDELADTTNGLGSSSDRFRVIVHAQLDDDQLGDAWVQDGAAVSPAELERLLDDVSAVVMVNRRGRPVWITDPARNPPAWMRRQVLARDDARCQFPGCNTAGYVELHHVTERRHGGHTNTDNLATICWFHHRALHTNGAHLEPTATGSYRAVAADGTVIEPNPRGQPPPKPPPSTGVRPPRFEYTRLDHYALDCTLHNLYRADGQPDDAEDEATSSRAGRPAGRSHYTLQAR